MQVIHTRVRHAVVNDEDALYIPIQKELRDNTNTANSMQDKNIAC